jgi:hypothetical protein
MCGAGGLVTSVHRHGPVPRCAVDHQNGTLFAERTIADAERSGDMTITGDRDIAVHLLFRQPA